MRLSNHKSIIFIVVLMGVSLTINKAIATDVGGIINTDTTWDLAGSPYVITSNVQVAEGVILTVEPGVEISNGNILVWGAFNAVGTTSSTIIHNSVTFSSESETALINIKFAELNYVSIFQYSGNGNIILEDSKINYLNQCGISSVASIERNVFTNSRGIRVNYGVAYIRNNLFYQQTEYAIRVEYDSNASVVTAEFNSFLSTDRIAVKIDETANIISLNNYWGTTNSTVIEAMIYDRNDDLSILNYVEYVPYLTEPHPDTPPLPPNEICVSNATEIQTALTNATSNGRADIIKIEQGTYNGNFIYASTEPYGVTIEGGYISDCASRVIDPTNTTLMNP